MRVLVVSPHPDDETLGAGGTILKYKSLGNRVSWLNITDAKEEEGWNIEFIQKRSLQIKKILD